jgi:hypothetical protein
MKLKVSAGNYCGKAHWNGVAKDPGLDLIAEAERVYREKPQFTDTNTQRWASMRFRPQRPYHSNFSQPHTTLTPSAPCHSGTTLGASGRDHLDRIYMHVMRSLRHVRIRFRIGGLDRGPSDVDLVSDVGRQLSVRGYNSDRLRSLFEIGEIEGAGRSTCPQATRHRVFLGGVLGTGTHRNGKQT